MRLMLLIFMPMFSTMTGQSDLLVFKKSACMGQCPVYSVIVSKDGLITYTGKRFVVNEGEFSRKLSNKELRKFKRKLKKAKFHKLDVEYGERIMDAQQTTFSYYSKKRGLQTIKVKVEMPEKLQKLEQHIISLLPMEAGATEGWELVKKPVNKEKRPPRRGETIGRKEMASSTLIVELKPSIQFDSWVKKYTSYGVRISKKIVPGRPLYLIFYDPARIDEHGLLQKLKKDSDVQEAQTNRQTTPR